MDSVAIFDEGGAAGQEVAWWPGQEAARAPAPFRDRVLAQFQSPQNLSYLSGLFARQVPAGPLRDFTLATLQDALLQYSGGAGRALELLASDPIARRGALRPAVGLWDEVRRLNRAFYEDRLAFLREQAHTIERGAPRDGVSEDDEPYHMRMFISDSLRPPGLEGLNLVAPLYDLLEDQALAAAGGGAGGCKDRFAGGTGPAEVYLYGDAPWSRGNPNRTPEQALAEYWGDDRAPTGASAEARREGLAYGGERRYMRYDKPPFWQKGGREGYELDIEETLGPSPRELGTQVRRWDMSRLLDPRGQNYRRHGARTGHVV